MNITKSLSQLSWIPALHIFLTSIISTNAQVYVDYIFDESGNWSWSDVGNGQLLPQIPPHPIGSGQVTQQIPGGGVQFDLSSSRFLLPLSSVESQTYGFFEAGTSFDLANLSDVVHFDDAYHFSYYSDFGESDLADLTSGSLTTLITSHGWTLPSQNMFYEFGSEGGNCLTFTVMTPQGVSVIFYGISDVPEPASFGLMILGGLLGLCRLLRRKQS